MPEITRLWDVSGEVGLAVANKAVLDGVAKKISSDEMQARIDEYRWVPEYPEFI
jgi:malic enzyme